MGFPSERKSHNGVKTVRTRGISPGGGSTILHRIAESCAAATATSEIFAAWKKRMGITHIMWYSIDIGGYHLTTYITYRPYDLRLFFRKQAHNHRQPLSYRGQGITIFICVRSLREWIPFESRTVLFAVHSGYWRSAATAGYIIILPHQSFFGTTCNLRIELS